MLRRVPVAKRIAAISSVFLLLGTLAACTSTKTASMDVDPAAATKLELSSGDQILVITSYRERFMLEIEGVHEDRLSGRTLEWGGAEVPVDQPVEVPYDELAFVQVVRPNPAATVGLVASVSLIGALVAAVSVVPPVMVMP